MLNLINEIKSIFLGFSFLIWILIIIFLLISIFFGAFFYALALVILVRIAWIFWLHYIRNDFISGVDWTLLEIIPPRDVLRSPKAMELFLTNALYQWSLKGGREEYWQGAVWFWFSLEIVSLEGQIHFYVRTPSRIRSLIETQMYAQYPQAQVKEVPDYTYGVDRITPDSKWNLWGCEWILEKHEAYPIKTYVDYGLDKETKEELKIDPISPVIELFSSLGKDEQMWLQFIVRPSKKKYHPKGKRSKSHDWATEAKNELEKMVEPFMRLNQRPDGTFAKEIRAPAFLDPLIKGINTKIQKIGFDVGIRSAYVAKKQVFSHNRRRDLRLIFRQYANPYLNSLIRTNATQADAYSGYWPASPKTVMILADRFLNSYRDREMYLSPMRQRLFNKNTVIWPFSLWIRPNLITKFCVLNVEELATLWHFPGQILKVPTLERIESKEASPPTNLPT